MVEMFATLASPPCPTNSNADMIDRALARSDEETLEPRATQKATTKHERKEIETLRKAREAKAAKKPKPEHVPEPLAPEPQTPKPTTINNKTIPQGY